MRFLATAIVTTLTAAALEMPARAAAWDKPGWTLTFQDEFAGAAPATSGGGGCGCSMDSASAPPASLPMLALVLFLLGRRRARRASATR